MIKKLLKSISIVSIALTMAFTSYITPALAEEVSEENTVITIDEYGNEVFKPLEDFKEDLEEDEEFKKDDIFDNDFKLNSLENFEVGELADISAVLGSDNREAITKTTKKPYSAICLIRVIYSDGYKTFATGWMAKNDVLVTSAHCVYDPKHKGWIKSIVVTPATHGLDDPYGLTEGYMQASIPSKFRTISDSDYKAGKTLGKNKEIWPYDYAVIRLKEPIGDKCGYLSSSSADKYVEDDYEIELPGYPSVGKYDYTMYTDYGSVVKYTSSLIYHDIDETDGQSGAPLIVEPKSGSYKVIGINSGINDSKSNRAVRVTSNLRSMIQDAHDL